MKKQNKPLLDADALSKMLQSRQIINAMCDRLPSMEALMESLDSNPKLAASEQFRKEITNSMATFEKNNRKIKALQAALYRKLKRKA